MALNAEKETQQNQNASGDYRILLSGNTNDTTEIAYINKNTNLRFNPGTQLLSVGGSISATGDLTITGVTQLNGQTYANSLTAGSLIVNGNTNFVQIPTAPTPANNSNDTSVATTAFVMNAFTANDAMVFKGTIGTGGTVTALPATHKQGWTYRVITAGTYAGKVCEIGDMIICVTDGTAASNDHWTVVQTNIDGAVTGPASATTEAIAIFNGTTGKIIKNSAKTITTATPAAASTSATIPTSNAVWSAITGASGYGKTGTVTSVQVQATSPVVSSSSAATSTSLSTTISLANGYGDTKNPYAAKTPNYVLAGPSSGTATAVPSFRALVAADIPSLTKSKISDFPTNISAFTNDSGYLTSYTETDPTVPAWAKTTNKPSYTASEVGAMATTHAANAITSTDIANWNAKTSNVGTVTSVRVQATAPIVSSSSAAATTSLNTTISLAATSANYVIAGPSSGTATAVPTYRKLVAADIPSLTKSKISDFPTNVSAFTNDSGYLTSFTETDPTVPAWAKATSKPTYTASEVGAAATSHTHGNLSNDGKITTTATIASGDKLVIVDSDSTAASKITGSSITFGTSTTTFLSNKGTWVTPSGTYSLPLAASGTRGGIQIGYSESGTNYAVKLSSEKAYVTVPWTDTKNTAGSTDTSSKIYLIGATSQAANPQTYSDNQIYATDGQLDANKVRVAEAVSLVYDTTLQALNFVFA